MKKIKTNIFAFAFLAMGTFVGVTSCSKDKEDDGDFTSENVEGVYAGAHILDIPEFILKGLGDVLPPDSITGEPTDLTKGFDDTLEVRVQGNVVKITSALLGITIDGELSASNAVKIKETKYDELNLGAVVSAKKASIATRVPVKFNSNAIGATTKVELRLKASQIATLTIPLDITTNGNFVKIAN